jgi:hypothetical protein
MPIRPTRSDPARTDPSPSTPIEPRFLRSVACTLRYGAGPLLAILLCIGCGEQDVKKVETNETRSVINELQSRNSTIESDTGKKSDWVELYNSSDTEESLEGYFISDDLVEKQKGKLGVDAVVPARGYLVLWLDDTENASAPLHFPFKLSGDGDYFFLNDPQGKVVESITIPPDPTGDNADAADVSYGAFPDGSDEFNWCQTPTPGRPNAADCAADAGT